MQPPSSEGPSTTPTGERVQPATRWVLSPSPRPAPNPWRERQPRCVHMRTRKPKSPHGLSSCRFETPSDHMLALMTKWAEKWPFTGPAQRGAVLGCLLQHLQDVSAVRGHTREPSWAWPARLPQSIWQIRARSHGEGPHTATRRDKYCQLPKSRGRPLLFMPLPRQECPLQPPLNPSPAKAWPTSPAPKSPHWPFSNVH